MATPRTSNPRTQRKRPGDLTGVNSQKLAEKRDADKAEAVKEAAEAVEAEREARRNSVVDYSTGGVAEPATEVEVENEPAVHVEVKDSYTAAELEAAIAAALAARDKTSDVANKAVTVDVDNEVSVRSKKEYIRVNYPIENMTYGRDVIDPGEFNEEEGRWVKAPRLGTLRLLNFEEGVKYLVDSDVADHLRNLGYVYEF